MGYGARIAFGCNIGAYFDGITSFSLHGWLCGVMAILGTREIRLRPQPRGPMLVATTERRRYGDDCLR
ncbi:MAG: YeeE/YedE thiosulfate transporter family protein [Marmoricola sp.]